MTVPTHAEASEALARAMAAVATDTAAPLLRSWGDGIIATFEAPHASVRKGDPLAPATGGFYVSPELRVEVGDHVFYFEQGAFRLVLTVLNRNGVIPEEITLNHLELTGRTVRSSVLSPPALAADVDNWAPDGLGDAYWVRVTQTGGPWTIRGMLFVPSLELGLVNVSAASVTLGHEEVTSAPTNRYLGPGNVDYVLQPNGSARVWGDPLSERWRVVG